MKKLFIQNRPMKYPHENLHSLKLSERKTISNISKDTTSFLKDPLLLIKEASERSACLNLHIESDISLVQETIKKISWFIFSFLKITIKSNLIEVHELLTNAIEHGNKNHKDKKVSIQIFIAKGYYLVTLTDEGEGFNWQEIIHKDLDLTGDSERGRGIALARIMSDSLIYNQRGNQVTIINSIF